MASFSAEAQNTTNGVASKYFISFFTSIKVEDNDVLIVNFPAESEVVATSGNTLTCAAVNGASQVTCTKESGTLLRIALNRVTQSTGLFKISADFVKNPPSLKASSPFGDIYVETKLGAKTCQFTGSTNVVNEYASELLYLSKKNIT